MVIICNFA